MKEEKEEVGAGGNGRPTTQAAWWAGVSLGGEGRGGVLGGSVRLLAALSCQTVCARAVSPSFRIQNGPQSVSEGLAQRSHFRTAEASTEVTRYHERRLTNPTTSSLSLHKHYILT